MVTRVRNILSAVAENLSGAFTLIMTFSVLLAVLCRYVLKVSVPWTEELARYLAIGLTYIGCGAALRQGKHVGLEFITSRLGEGARVAVAVTGKLVMLAFFTIFSYQAWGMVLNEGTWQISPAMRIPMYVPYATLLLGGVLMMLELVFQVCDDLAAGLRRPSRPVSLG